MTLSRLNSDFEAFDLLVKNMFNHDSFFAPVTSLKINHPVDIYEDVVNGMLCIDVAGTGLTKKDIELKITGDVLDISYKKEQEDLKFKSEVKDIYRGISRKSFQLAYKIPSKFNLGKAEASMENGLLHISIPYIEEENQTKTLTIN
jgi:HSP20 family protein